MRPFVLAVISSILFLSAFVYRFFSKFVTKRPIPYTTTHISWGAVAVTLGIAFIFAFDHGYLWTPAYHFYRDRGLHQAGTDAGSVILAVVALIGHFCDVLVGLVILPVARDGVLGRVLRLEVSTLLRFHKLIAYLLVAAVTVHMVVFIVWIPVWAQGSVLLQRAFAFNNPNVSTSEADAYLYYNLCLATGLAALLVMVVLVVTSLPKMRRTNYNTFYYTHTLSILVFLFASLHASTNFYFLLPGLFLWAFDWVNRTRSLNHIVSAQLQKDDNGWFRITIPYDAIPCHMGRRLSQTELLPLKTFYLNIPNISKLQNHPFTTCSGLVATCELSPYKEISFLWRVPNTGKNATSQCLEWTTRLSLLFSSRAALTPSDLELGHAALKDLPQPQCRRSTLGALALANTYVCLRSSSSAKLKCKTTDLRIVWSVRDIEDAELVDVSDMQSRAREFGVTIAFDKHITGRGALGWILALFSPSRTAQVLFQPTGKYGTHTAAAPLVQRFQLILIFYLPERGVDDDNDSFMLNANDSASSLAVSLSEEAAHDLDWEERCRISPVYRLPAELLISVFARLSSTKDLQSCMLVSRDWARNSVGLLWHRPQTNNWGSVQSVVWSIRKADKKFAYQDLVKRLNLSTLGPQVSDGTIMGMIDCKRIERLTLTNCSKLTDMSLSPLLEGNRSLVALDVTGLDQLTDQALNVVADNCLRLQGLNVTGCRKLTDASLVAIAKNCRHLKRIKFNGCAQLTDASVLTVAAHSSHLLEIDLYQLPLLESPSITALLTSCRHLRELRLAHCTGINDSAFLNVPSKKPVFDALRILDLTDCAELTDKAVEKIVATCPRLRNLILAKCRQLTDRAVYAITRLGKNLHYIHLGHCARITDPSIQALAKACSRIRYIDLACCSNLTDTSITQLATLPKLKRIGLVKCAGITDRSIHALATSGGRVSGKSRDGNGGVSVLERVHLSYCTLLTLDGIHTLLNNCPRLTHLSLTGVQAFLREDLTIFCREAPSEFNDHQREVFCVFSGPGVTRLREYLNADRTALENNIVPDSDDDAANATVIHRHQIHGDPIDDEDMEDDGETTPIDTGPVGVTGTPVININVHSTPGPGDGAFIMHAASPAPAAPGAPHIPPFSTTSTPIVPPLVPSHGGGGGGALWAAGPAFGSGMHHPQPATSPNVTMADSSFMTGVPITSAVAQQGAAGAQQVTGMMGATMLDDFDETDEAFGEGSEIVYGRD
ncbi:SCF ubiquitin ligase complex subunit [Taxawa tesnikishii (nom. ined.)]|nr:SCF ubiquitin ligase complex subunit [Dothideales sp. JES 119]